MNQYYHSNPGVSSDLLPYKELMVDGHKIREHRHVMQTILKRKLSTKEHVHHINGNGLDNRPENLLVLSHSEHSKLEYLERMEQLKK